MVLVFTTIQFITRSVLRNRYLYLFQPIVALLIKSNIHIPRQGRHLFLLPLPKFIALLCSLLLIIGASGLVQAMPGPGGGWGAMEDSLVLGKIDELPTPPSAQADPLNFMFPPSSGNPDTLVSFSSAGEEYAHDIVVDTANQWVYMVGAFEVNSLFPGLNPNDMNRGTGNGFLDGFLVKVDYNGVIQWAVNMGGPGDDECLGLTLAADGNIYVTGYFDDEIRFTSVGLGYTTLSPFNFRDMFLAAYSPTGDLQYATFGGGPNDDLGLGITSNAAGVYVTGVYDATANFNGIFTESTYNNRINGFVAHYGFRGPAKWVSEIKSDADDIGTGLFRELANAIVADEANVYVIGISEGDNLRFTDSSGTVLPAPILTDVRNGPNTFICSYDSAGTFRWGTQVDDGSPNKRGYGIAVDCDGVYVSGTIHDQAIFPSGFVANLLYHDLPFLMSLDENTGTEQWRLFLENSNPANHEDAIQDVVADGLGNLYLCGNYGAADFWTPDTTLTAANSLDGYIARFSNTGNFDFAASLNGPGIDGLYSLAPGGLDLLFSAGEFANSISCPPQTLSGPNNPNVLLSRMEIDSGNVSLSNCCAILPIGGTTASSADSICLGDSVTISLTGELGNILWEFSTNGGATWLPLAAPATSTITDAPTQSTQYRAILSTQPTCPTDTSSVVQIDLITPPTPAQAGPDQFICGDTFAILAGNAPTVGTGAWSIASGPGALTNPSAPNALVTGLGNAPTVLIWTISNGLCTDSQDTVTYRSVPLPLVDLGPDSTGCASDSILLDADPNNLYPGATFTWSTGATTPTLLAPIPGTYAITIDTLGCTGRDTINLLALGNPVLPLPPDTNFCAGSSVLLDANPNGVNANAHFLWSTGDTTPQVSIVQGGWVTVQIGIGTCPPITDSVLVNAIPVPQVNLGPDTTACAGDSILLDADPGNLYPGATFSWSNGATTPTLLAPVPGSYNVVVDTLGCTGSDTIQLLALGNPVLPLPPDTTICDGDSIVLDANPGGVNAGAQFLWSTGDTSAQIIVTTGGLVQLELNFATCPPLSDSIQVTVAPLPQVNLGADTLLCGGDSLLLDADPGNLYPGASFSWSNGATTNNIWVTSAGNYAVTIDTLGCTGSDDIGVSFTSIPQLTLPSDTSFCDGDAVQLDANPNGTNNGAQFLWSSGDTSAQISVNQSGIFSVAISFGNCPPASDSILVTAWPNPVLDLGADTMICPQDSVVLVADPGMAYPGATYNWNSGDTTNQVVVGSGFWLVVLTDANGCIGTDDVLINPASSNLSFTGLDPNYCEGDPVSNLLPNTPGGQFSGPGINGNNFDPGAAGPGLHIVQYSFLDTSGCLFTVGDSTQVEALIVADAGPDREVYFSESSTLQGNAPLPGTGLWTIVQSYAQLAAPNSATSAVAGLSAGSNVFQWTVTNGNCQSSDEVNIVRNPFIPERIFTPNDDGVNDFFVIPGLADYPGSSMQIFNRWGDQVFASDDYQNDWGGLNASGNPLQDDTYFYLLTLSDGQQINGYVELKR